MISFLVDQNFNEHIVDGVTRRDATVELVHVRDIGLAAAPDPAVLEWAAADGRVVLTHDRRTMAAFVRESGPGRRNVRRVCCQRSDANQPGD